MMASAPGQIPDPIQHDPDYDHREAVQAEIQAEDDFVEQLAARYAASTG